MYKTEEAVNFYNLGVKQKLNGQIDEAIKLFEKALNLEVKLIPAYNTLAICLIEQKKFKEAVRVYKNAINIEPNTWDLYYNLANIYLETGKHQKAIHYYKKAVNYEPNADVAYANLGICYLLTSNKLAIPSFKKAINLSPVNVQYYYTLAYIYERASQLANAVKYYEKTIEINPNYEFALSHLFTTKRKICDWKGLEKIRNQLEKTHKESPWASLLRSENLESNLISAKAWSQDIQEKVPKNLFNFKTPGKKRDKLKIAYISGHLSNHPVSYTTTSVFKFHDRARFEVTAYSYGPKDKFTRKIESSVDKFVDLQKFSNEEAAQRIFNDKIDILVDLTGYTEDNRAEILAMKPAPIQITWAGLTATTGSDFIDYFIADKIIVPAKNSRYYSEKMIYLPPCFCPIQDIIPESKSKPCRKDFGLPENKFVFASFNQIYKIDKSIWDTWINILRRTPQSVLWVFVQNKEGEKNLRSQAKKSGIDPGRIIFTGSLPIEKFYQAISLADLALDTLVYGGGTTTYMSLLKGVPWVTLKGKHPASLFSSSVLKAAGLDILITKNLHEYENLSIELSKENYKFLEIKKLLKSAMLNNTILNTAKKTKHLEKEYERIWIDYLDGR